jgi:hypothetical protein
MQARFVPKAYDLRVKKIDLRPSPPIYKKHELVSS